MELNVAKAHADLISNVTDEVCFIIYRSGGLRGKEKGTKAMRVLLTSSHRRERE